jgi:hypothetical protein
MEDKVCWHEKTDPCFADSPENLMSLLMRLILMKHTMAVVLPWPHWEVTCSLFYGEEELFSLLRRVLTILTDGIQPHGP